MTAGGTDGGSDDSVRLDIDLEALQRSAAKVFAKPCVSIQKFSEGGFHKIYLLGMEGGTECLGRVAFPEYPRWKTESEVAVMKYVRDNTTITVPQVYYWNSSSDNPVGAEYMLMERLPGVRLSDVWEELSMEEKKEVLLQVIDIRLILKNHTFPQIGSIFFGETKEQFTIGQAVKMVFFVDKRANLKTNRGPFDTTKDYVLAALQSETLHCRTFTSPEHQDLWIWLYEELATLVPKYFLEGVKDTFVLTHGDFHSSNILVEGTKITGVIDWECSGAFPLEWFCNYPIWIIDNPMAQTTEEESNNNLKLQEFFREEMLRRDPQFIDILENGDERRAEFHSIAFIYFKQGGKAWDFFERLQQESSEDDEG